jgi:hypothetical protein
MTKTTVTLRYQRIPCRSEKEAYRWTIEAFLSDKPGLFTDPKSGPSICTGGNGRPLFASSRNGMIDPVRLSNGFYAETNLNEGEKVQILDKLGQYAGWKLGRDWHWQAENRPPIPIIDTDALLAKLAKFLGREHRL